MITRVNKPLLEQMRIQIANRIGLDFSRRKFEDLEREVIRVAGSLAYKHVDDFIVDYLGNCLSPLQIESFIEAITIGETYFFRDEKVFDVLEKVILPNLIHKKQQLDKRIRIWCSGCSNGEEAYSIAILMHKMRYKLNGIEVSILATDVNINALNKAMEGIFTEWSFRNTSEAFKKNYFLPVEDDKFMILPEIKQLVEFEYLNLAENRYPSPLNKTNDMDIIFCRNVLMYLTDACVSSILNQFSSCLLNEGYLIVSACEGSEKMTSKFKLLNYPDCVLYQKSNHIVALDSMKSSQNEKVNATVRPQNILLEADHGLKSDIAMALLCRTVANQGKLSEALAMCESTLALDKLNPSYHYLHAMILVELERFEEAIDSLRRTLFLDGNRASAYFMLGSIARQLGSTKEAKINFENALEILRSYSPEMILPDSDGLPVNQLTELIQEAINCL